MEKKVLFTVKNFDVTDNTVYRLRQKKDPSAPEEMQEKGYSKYPGSSTTIRCHFLKDGGVYDTGFEESSRLYVHLTDPKERTRIVKQRRDNVLKPFLNLRGISDDRYKGSSIEDWDDFKIHLDTIRSFRTNDIKERMELYIGLVHGNIVPPGEDEYSYEYDGADFVLESTEIKTKSDTSAKLTKMEAQANYFQLMKSRPDSLLDILVYLGHPELYKAKADDSIFLNYLESKILNSVQATERFLEAYDLLSTDEGEIELKLHRIIIREFKNKNKDFAKDGGQIIYKGSPIGKTEKEASKFLAENKNMETSREELLFLTTK